MLIRVFNIILVFALFCSPAWAQDGDTCTVTAPYEINRREGPGTNYGIAGALAADETAEVGGQTTGADSFVWWNLVDGSWVRADVVEAEGACEAVPLIEVISHWEAQAAYDRGVALWDNNDPEGALAEFETALKGFQQSGDRSNEALTLLGTGFINRHLGRYDIALEAFETSLEIWREIDDKVHEATTLHNIGEVHNNQGRYAEALDYFQQSLAIRRELDRLIAAGPTINDIGLIYWRLGQYEQAIDYLLEALAIFRQTGDRKSEGTCLHNIGLIYAGIDRYEEALAYYEQALAIHRALNNVPREADTLNAMGAAYRAQEQDDEALDHYQQALALFREVGDRSGQGSALNNIGYLYYKQEQYEEALANYEKALDIRREIGDRDGEEGTLKNIALVYYLQGDFEHAIDYYKQAVEVIEAIHADIRLEGGQAAFLADKTLPYDQLVALLLESNPVEAFSYAERARSRTFLYRLANTQLSFGEGADEEMMQEWRDIHDELVEARERLVRLGRRSPLPVDDIRSTRARIRALERELSQLEDLIAIQNPTLSQFTRVNVPALADIQAVIPSDVTLLSYYLARGFTVVFVLTPDRMDAVVLPAAPEEIRETVDLFRADLDASAPPVDLYDWLIAPIAPYLETEKLVIAPHDVLNYLPFAALTDPDGAFLGESYTLSYTPSATVYTVMAQASAVTSEAGRVLVLGNPDTQDTLSLPALPGAEAEAEAVAALLGVEAQLGADATEGRLRAEIGEAGVVHIAAHGAFDKANPLSSFLALAPDDAHDGSLEVREIYALPLRENHPLVVLSACQTAVGDLTDGDEFQGLTRAFLLSGARNVVASLWSVSDAATSVLMTAFYENRAAGMGDAEALAAAQKTVREDAAHPEWRSPFYWAAFVLVGLGEA